MNKNVIGILGTGRMATRLAQELVNNGHHVVLGSRDEARAARIARAISATAITPATYQRAASQAFVIPAMFIRDGAFDTLAHLRAELAGATIIDIFNPFNADYSDFLLPWTTSASEELNKLLPDSIIVGAFKNVFWETFDVPMFPEGHSDVYVMSDDEDAKENVVQLFHKSPFRFVDAGRLANARTVERMTLLAAEMGARYKYSPRIGWRFLGEPWEMGKHDRFAKIIA